MKSTKIYKNIYGIFLLITLLLLVFMYYIKFINKPKEYQQGILVKNKEVIHYIRYDTDLYRKDH